MLKYKYFRKSRLKHFKYNTRLNFGNFGLKAIESGLINLKQIESARKVLTNKIGRKSKIWVKVFYNLAITKKSLGLRMGKGKGKIHHFAAKLKSGSIIFEIISSNSNNQIIVDALKDCRYKLPVRTIVMMV